MAEHTRGPRTRYALSTMLRALTFVAFACLSTSLPPVVAHAQAVDEARAEALRARAREAVAAGQLEEAFGHVRVAAELFQPENLRFVVVGQPEGLEPTVN